MILRFNWNNKCIIISFCRQEGAIAKYSSVLTTLGVVTGIFIPKNEQELVNYIWIIFQRIIVIKILSHVPNIY